MDMSEEILNSVETPSSRRDQVAQLIIAILRD
jgi:hypothetical protein